MRIKLSIAPAIIACLCVVIYTGCKKNPVKENPPVNQPQAAILSFKLDTGEVAAAVNNTDSSTITVTVYPYLNLFHRTVTIALSKGATVSPASGTTVNFTANMPYTFIVTSSAGVARKWQVTVKIQGDNGQWATAAYKDTTVTNFFRRTSGQIASDGGYTIPLANGGDLWLMGDSHINDYRASDGTINWLFQVHNAGLLQPANDWVWQHTQTLTGNTATIPSYIKLNPSDSYWTWPSAGYQNGDTVYVYCPNLTQVGTGNFGFGSGGNDMLAKIHYPDMTVLGYQQLQNFNGINFGITFLNKGDGYMYVYGYGTSFIYSNLFLARFPINNVAAPWTFWDGTTFNSDVTKAAVIAQGVSNGVSINYVNGKFIIVSTEFSVGCNEGKRIFLSTSSSPVGPFTTAKPIYTITDTTQNDYPFFYAAIIHPEYTNSKGEVLITYAINGYPGCLPAYNAQYRSNPDWYRLRGVRIPWSVITSN
jgi:hypothetical protein